LSLSEDRLFDFGAGVRSSSKYCLAWLIALSAIASDGRAATGETTACYRPGISQAGSAVVIQQADRLVIVQGGKRTVAQVRLLDNEKVGPGRAIPVEVTLVADADGNGAVVRIEDRKVICDGDASIEFIPRQDISGSAAAADLSDGSVALNNPALASVDGHLP
jgi:hypothetical protein